MEMAPKAGERSAIDSAGRCFDGSSHDSHSPPSLGASHLDDREPARLHRLALGRHHGHALAEVRVQAQEVEDFPGHRIGGRLVV